MRIVFDTNVLFAAFLTSGLCSELYETARDLRAIRLSDRIAAELAGKLVDKAGLSKTESQAVLAIVRRDSEFVEPAALRHPVCRDPDDDWILATALAAGADCLVTGDQDLLVLRNFQGIPIVNPRQCLTWLSGAG